jgi:hypothetical protein
MARQLILVAAIFVAILASMTSIGRAEEPARQLSCSGSKMDLTTSIRSAITAQLTFVSPRSVAIDLGSGNIDGPISSDNNIALKFQAGDFVGEFFHYTNYLFLTYQTPHFARLTCMPE